VELSDGDDDAEIVGRRLAAAYTHSHRLSTAAAAAAAVVVVVV